MSNVTAQHGVRIGLWMRAFTPAGAEDRCQNVLRRLHQLDENDTVDRVSITRWGTYVSTSSSNDNNLSVLDTSATRESIVIFEEWADGNAVTLYPAFERRTATSFVSDEVHELLRVPVMCLAVYIDNELRGVFPCSDDERVYTIEDCLCALERDDDRVLPEDTDWRPVPANGQADPQSVSSKVR